MSDETFIHKRVDLMRKSGGEFENTRCLRLFRNNAEAARHR
jgi:hypothetical protein